MINFAKCSLRFSRSFTLSSVNWQIHAGEAWAVTGPNGSGKSALVAALTGEGEVVSGERALGGHRTAVVSLEEQARLIEREKRRDDSDLTDKVSAGTSVSEMLTEECVDPAIKDELIRVFGLDRLLERGFRALSTGETRKVLITRALSSKPDLLILDEPFEGLDAATVPRLHLILEKLSRSTTMVMACNRIDEIPDFVTDALTLDHHQNIQTFGVRGGSEARTILMQISQLKYGQIALPEPDHIAVCPLNEDGSLVRLRHGKVAYTDNTVFEDLNWTIQPGQHWQVKGPNGSGKTCLLNLITGDHPQCYVNDLSLFGINRGHGESIWEVKQHIGFVSTGLHWDYRLGVSVRNVIVSGFFDSIGLYQRANESQVQIADQWLMLLGLGDKARQAFSSLSYGEQRMLLIARAMIKHPPLLLLDEPCLGLDEANRYLVLALIRRICDEGETTVIYVTHHEEDRVKEIDNILEL